MAASTPVRYQSPDEDSARWVGFPFRDGDLVISARSKTGTTWVQMICGLLIFQAPQLPAPLAQLSPWLDHLIAPREQVYARLAAQQHRRFIKTHTPLDGIPLDARATYIVTARHPLDMAVSLYHQGGNIDRARVRQLAGQPEPAGPPRPRPPVHDWLLSWIADDGDPRKYPDSLPGVMWHLCDAWARRAAPNVLLVHYDNLLADLEGQMRWLAGRLEVAVPEQAWPALVRAASFESMSSRADTLVPTAGIFKSNAAFSVAAPQARDARSSATKKPPPTTTARPSWHHPTCSRGSTRLARTCETHNDPLPDHRASLGGSPWPALARPRPQ